MNAPVLEFRGVTKAFGEREVLHGIDLELAEHEAERRVRTGPWRTRLGLRADHASTSSWCTS